MDPTDESKIENHSITFHYRVVVAFCDTKQSPPYRGHDDAVQCIPS